MAEKEDYYAILGVARTASQKEIAAAYNVLDEAEGVALRGLFIINPEGVVQHATVNNLPVGRNVEETLRVLQAFQHVRATGEATPSGWTPGAKTLKPGPDLVGQVWKVWKP